MTDIFTAKKRSQIMSKIKGKDSGLEIFIRKGLFKKGFRFRKQYGPRKIDIAFPKLKIAIFIDSCFWHYCPKHRQVPKSNMIFWRKKLSKNAIRDKVVTHELKKQGWTVLRIWEHDISRHPELILNKASKTIRRRSYQFSSD